MRDLIEERPRGSNAFTVYSAITGRIGFERSRTAGFFPFDIGPCFPVFFSEIFWFFRVDAVENALLRRDASPPRLEMKFFQGDLTEAVAEREDRGAALVVFVEGADGLSGNYRLILEEEERLPREAYVAVRIPFRSPEYEKFADIYRVVPVPSVFVIGCGGLPVAVVSSAVGRDELYSVLNSALSGLRRTVRILLKLPAGETFATQFPETSTLAEVRLYAEEFLGVKNPFRMIAPFPRRVFTSEEESQTLARLQLYPTSTILIVSTERPGLRLRAYRAVLSVVEDFLRIFRRLKLWLTDFLYSRIAR